MFIGEFLRCCHCKGDDSNPKFRQFFGDHWITMQDHGAGIDLYIPQILCTSKSQEPPMGLVSSW